MWQIIIPILTLIAGLVGGFFIGVFYLRKQLESMQNNPEMIQKMAKQMGYNMNKQQMNKVQTMMKNQNLTSKKPNKNARSK
ncbi:MULTISPECIES: YneF family protein [Paenibacillus]|uniref:YneF family protein n=1 Tax=Paenibacillus TaxID=44249 RepID=UPI00020D6910|nr:MULTISPECIES: YneF family protein [Paenibacillus]EGL14048.1 hypothetical protein HMPREF9413_3777 [Paenibacillus sp. HGF7]EPD88799.1 hypothetical protein HMPREF1207_01940 [Paenibacillus sp. HGH0039]MBV6717104.1 YneF family protein [Paenibacillus chitinolyticus]MEC0248824.1 YneF family protein [Paenibacillus chitinolyticus]SEG53342.1 hypothetical protein SAMN02799616_03405 [Paenibacillus sp. UNC499MF]